MPMVLDFWGAHWKASDLVITQFEAYSLGIHERGVFRIFLLLPCEYRGLAVN
jgi:hypothetical protein